MPAGGFRMSFSALRSNIKFIVPEAIRSALDSYTYSFARAAVERAAKYPPVPAGSKYIRTGTLMRSWRINNISTGEGIRHQLSNYATDPRGRPYSRLVYGPTDQWPTHAAHGWPNIADVLEELGGRGLFRRQVQEIIKQGVQTA